MRLELTHPMFLLGLALLPWLVWAYWRSLVDFSRKQRRISLAFRILIFVLIVLALAGLTRNAPTREKMIVFLVDQSRSIDEDAAQKAERFLNDARLAHKDVPQVTLPFASDVKHEHDDNDNWNNATNIAGAIEAALALRRPDRVPYFVLLSDGNETTGNALAVAANGNVPISTVPLPASTSPETQLSEIRLPPQIRQGESFYVDVVVHANRESEGVISVFHGDHKVVEETRPLAIGENVFRFQQTADDGRQQIFYAKVDSPEDTILENNFASGIVFADGKPRVLLIESEPEAVYDFLAALEEQEIEIELREPEGMPQSLEELANYEAVILSNVPATAISTGQMELLRSYVRDLGGGLIMLGGDQSFGLGGYSATPLEDVFPVRCDFEKEKEKPSLAMCLVIDRSGSMDGEKIELAKEAAKSVVELLSPQDYVSVIAFDDVPHPVMPIRSVTAPQEINTMIGRITSSGGTNIYPAMVEAYQELGKVSAQLKHVILLTDGQSTPGDFESIARQMAISHITVSSVGIGDADHDLLESIATIGEGRHYACDDPRAIPQIFAKETVMAGKSAIREMPFLPVVITPAQALNGIPLDTAPPLLGFVVTRVKPTSQVILATETGEPLLSWWRYGLGMAAAFTSDVKPRWSAEWIAWPEFSAFWAQIIRHCLRTDESRGGTVRLTREDGRLHLTLDAVDESHRFLNRGEGELTLIGPDGKKTLPLEVVAPGRYEARVDAERQGTYYLQTTFRDGETVVAQQTRGYTVGYPDELRLRETNTQRLEQLARATGGLYDPAPQSLFAENDARVAWRVTPLWPWLLTTALCFYVFDVLLRRIELFEKTRRTSSAAKK